MATPASSKDASQQVTREVLEHLAIPYDTRELWMVEVTYPPGAEASPHGHPVGGLIYIIEGVVESAYGNDEPRRYRAGESLQDRAGETHIIFRNCDRERPLRFLATYLLEPGSDYFVQLS